MSEIVLTPGRSHQRMFEVGSVGWTVQDLNDPAYEKAWESLHVELVNGVIVNMPPPFYAGSAPSGRLIRMLMKNPKFQDGLLTSEFDLLIDDDTIFRPDFTWMSRNDEARHRAQAPSQGRGLAKSRLAVPPTLVIESISEGYQRHDRVLKFRRYAEFGVRNYWIIDGFERRLDCFTLDGTSYRLDDGGSDAAVVEPTLFSPTAILLADLWVD